VSDATELNCKELVELITAYLEGTLPAAERARFDAHLPNCSGCRNYLHQMQLTIRTLGSLSEATIAPVARERLLATFRTWKSVR
jgi:anti-sigma factor RsiW